MISSTEWLRRTKVWNRSRSPQLKQIDKLLLDYVAGSDLRPLRAAVAAWTLKEGVNWRASKRNADRAVEELLAEITPAGQTPMPAQSFVTDDGASGTKSKYKTIGMLRNGGYEKDRNDLLADCRGVPYLLTQPQAALEPSPGGKRQAIPQRGTLIGSRDEYLVTVGNANLLRQGNVLLDTEAGPQNSFIFVMSGAGEIYSASKSVVQHHSAFLAGGPVAAAGWWKIVKGRVIYISNSSGHYQPPLDYTQQVLKELKRRNVNIDGVETRWTGVDSVATARYFSNRNTTFQRIVPTGVKKSAF
ncbi:hypothetical protein [Herbaspirillum sp. SJZ107]|uniref:hypothetical protein n=1 Tax=Herbaspirillum sp. SJZ107 TaxID=2572881 RepID=UPI0011503D03|nr:hypothetical protein [Herbaspirillum sp. SJZ107]TQK08249.1 hypothetical protein FBX97_3563 [Herbaspirillum sp. SJZ107]